MEHNQFFLQFDDCTLNVSSVGAETHDKAHCADYPDYYLDTPHHRSNHDVAAP